MEWLAQGWIIAKGSWNADKARVEVARDWYGPFPKPALPRVMETSPEERSVDPHGESLAEEEAAPVPLEFARQRPRDLGWANSSHWMEEEI